MTWKEILEKQKSDAQPEAVGDEQEPVDTGALYEKRLALEAERKREEIESRIRQAAEPRWRFFSTGEKKQEEKPEE